MLAFEQRQGGGRAPQAPSSTKLSTRSLQRPPPPQQQFQPPQPEQLAAGQRSQLHQQQREPIQQQARNLHSTPTPSSRGLNLNRQAVQHQSQQPEEEGGEVDWATLLAADGGNHAGQQVAQGTVTGNNAPAPPRGKVDPSLYSPPQFSPRRLQRRGVGSADNSDQQGQQPQFSTAQLQNPSLQQTQPKLHSSRAGGSSNAPHHGGGLGFISSERPAGSMQRHQWDLNQFKDSPVAQPRRLGAQRTNSTDPVNNQQQQAPSAASRVIQNASYQPSPRLGLRSLGGNPPAAEQPSAVSHITDRLQHQSLGQ